MQADEIPGWRLIPDAYLRWEELARLVVEHPEQYCFREKTGWTGNGAAKSYGVFQFYYEKLPPRDGTHSES